MNIATVTAIYAGATEGKALYYGPQLLWNVAGWEPPAFSPASIAGLRLWLDASVGLYDAETGGNPVTTAAPVLRWEDQSGNGFHATATASTAPSLALSQVNSLPGILFPSAGGKYFSFPNPLNSTSASVFVVVQPMQTGSDGGPLIGMIGSNNEYWSDSHYPYRNSNIEDGFAATTRKTITPLPSGMFSWHLYNVTSANSNWRYLFNGAVYYSTTSNTYNGASFTGRTPKIGYSDSRGTWFFRGTIAEIAIYNSALSEGDRKAVTEYLRAKYNLWTPSTLPNNLLAFYRLNDAGGGTLSLADTSGNNRTLANTGGVSLGTGIISGAASFQSSRYLSAAIPFNTAQDWAISFWANISNLKNYFTLIGGESLGRLHIHGDASGRLYLNNGYSDVSVNNFFAAGQWDHYAFSRSGSTLSIYKNSALVNTYSLTASYTQTSTLYIGRIIFTGDDFQFVGRMDALGLWSRAITASEVSQLYNNGAALEI